MVWMEKYNLPEGNLDPVSWFDISIDVLNNFILKDQIEVPDQVFIDSLFRYNLTTNLEMFLMYNIYHFNLLKKLKIYNYQKRFTIWTNV